MELIGHQASLPIAVSILYQEYPFVLADVFLKRAMTLLSLTTATLLAHLGVDRAGLLASARLERDTPQLVFLGVALGTALLYPIVTRFSTWFVDTVVLRRVDYERLRILVSRGLNEAATSREALEHVCAALGPALSAAQVTWQESSTASPADGLGLVTVPSLGITADLSIPTAEAPRFTILVRAMSGGRRLLSDDVAMLESVALMSARRIDGLRLEQERAERSLREEETQRLASEAELRALRAQLDPHFLFNALTTIGYLIGTAPDRALSTLLRLTDLLRHVLGSDRRQSTLGSELALITAYLDIERARFEERLTVEIVGPDDLHALAIPPLLIQPLVENAIKHGVAPYRQDGRLSLRARVDHEGAGAMTLVIQVEDSGPGLSTSVRLPRGTGVGLRNLEQRLERIYGDAASFALTSRPGGGTTAELRLPLPATLARPPAARLRGARA
jgi:signal transduction histidine kinase